MTKLQNKPEYGVIIFMSNIKKTDKSISTTRTSKKEIGSLGEGIACNYLENKGYKVIERNYLKKFGEIDIIAQKDGVYYFVEVKTVTCEPVIMKDRGINGSYKPEDNVHPLKLKRMARVVETYILDKKIFNFEWEAKVITVSLNMATRRAKIDIFDIVL
jgi:putative endonuclease